MPSFILIHPTVWPQYSNVTYRQTGVDTGQTDRQTHRQRSDDIERTVLQTVAQKCVWRVSKVRVTWQGRDCLVIMVRDAGVLIITTPAVLHFTILLGNWKLWIPLFMRIKY